MIEREARALDSQRRNEDEPPGFDHTNEARQKLIPLLDRVTEKMKQHRQIWESLSYEERATRPDVNELIVEALNTIMKIIKLDRANEEILLKNGSIPIKEIPPSMRQKPGQVVNIYKQHSK